MRHMLWGKLPLLEISESEKLEMGERGRLRLNYLPWGIYRNV